MIPRTTEYSRPIESARNFAGAGPRKLAGLFEMVGPNGLEPSTSSVSRKRSNQTELRAYMERLRFNSTGWRVITATLVGDLRFSSGAAMQKRIS